MKVDVTVSYHDRRRFWGRVAKGLLANRMAIKRVIVVHSRKWSGDWRPTAGMLPIETLEVPETRQRNFNIASVVNAGFKAADTRFVVHLDDDVVLMPGAIDAILADIQPFTLHNGLIAQVPDKTTWAKLEVFRPNEHKFTRDLTYPYGLATGCFFACHKGAFTDLGGWDEEMQFYGLQDAEFAMRWMAKYGYHACRLRSAVGLHLGEARSGMSEPPEGSYNRQVVELRLKELVGKRGPWRVKTVAG